MALFDFLRGTPTIHGFAESLMREMRRAGFDRELSYDKENERVLAGAGDSAQSIYVSNFYREFLSLPRRARKQHLAARANVHS